MLMWVDVSGRLSRLQLKWFFQHPLTAPLPPFSAHSAPFSAPLTCSAQFQITTNRKWPMENRMVTWLMTSHDRERSSHDPNIFAAHYLHNGWRMEIQSHLQWTFCRKSNMGYQIVIARWCHVMINGQSHHHIFVINSRIKRLQWPCKYCWNYISQANRVYI